MRGLRGQAAVSHGVPVRARRYYALIDVTYMGGTLPDDDREALRDALRTRMPDLSLRVTTQPNNVVRVAATQRADNPLEAITALSMVLDQALLGIRVGPVGAQRALLPCGWRGS
jgi:uncharacterized membrane protein